ncbi:MAG: hypothetical protein N2444_00140 [Methylocystis sp.]|nr:hypothetical protein [Methylocystis sp.]
MTASLGASAGRGTLRPQFGNGAQGVVGKESRADAEERRGGKKGGKTHDWAPLGCD